MSRAAPLPQIDGALVVNKPGGRTSHDVVEAVRRIAGFRQIGHLGTLDPLATGVLVLLLGRATRLAQFYAGRRKRYACAVRFGFATDSYDSQGEAQGPDLTPSLDRESLEKFAASLTGRIQQTPPIFSAKKIHGRPAHELARKKKKVELKPVEVAVHEFRLDSIENSIARFTIECGAGTYIRALAHEMGKMQGSGAHLCEIVRTAVGEFTLDQAATLEDLSEAARNGKFADYTIRLEHLLPELPCATVLPVLERRILHGAKFTLPLSQIQTAQMIPAPGATAELDSGEWKPARLRVFNGGGDLIAIAKAVVPRTYQPLLVFAQPQ